MTPAILKAATLIAEASFIGTQKSHATPDETQPDQNPYIKHGLDVIYFAYSGIPEDGDGQAQHAGLVARQLSQVDKFKAAGILSLFRDQSPEYAELIVSKMRQNEVDARLKSGNARVDHLDSDLILGLINYSYIRASDCSDELNELSKNPLFRSAMIMSLAHPHADGSLTLRLKEGNVDHEINYRFVAATGGIYLFSDQKTLSRPVETSDPETMSNSGEAANIVGKSPEDLATIDEFRGVIDDIASSLPEQETFPDTEWTPDISRVIDDIMNDFGDTVSLEALPQTEETLSFLENFLAEGKQPPEGHMASITYDKETGRYEVAYEKPEDSCSLQSILDLTSQKPIIMMQGTDTSNP